MTNCRRLLYFLYPIFRRRGAGSIVTRLPKFTDRRLQRSERRPEEAGFLVRGTRLPSLQLHRPSSGSFGQPQNGWSQRLRAESALQHARRSRVGR